MIVVDCKNTTDNVTYDWSFAEPVAVSNLGGVAGYQISTDGTNWIEPSGASPSGAGGHVVNLDYSGSITGTPQAAKYFRVLDNATGITPVAQQGVVS